MLNNPYITRRSPFLRVMTPWKRNCKYTWGKCRCHSDVHPFHYGGTNPQARELWIISSSAFLNCTYCISMPKPSRSFPENPTNPSTVLNKGWVLNACTKTFTGQLYIYGWWKYPVFYVRIKKKVWDNYSVRLHLVLKFSSKYCDSYKKLNGSSPSSELPCG